MRAGRDALKLLSESHAIKKQKPSPPQVYKGVSRTGLTPETV
jgi:hypothetical protein